LSDVASLSITQYLRYSEALLKNQKDEYRMKSIIFRNSYHQNRKDFNNFLKNFELHEVTERVLSEREMQKMGLGKKG